MTDILDDLKAVRRETGSRRVGSADTRTVLLSRRYAAPIDEVWDAITDPSRLSRWFLPVTGDLRLGGTYRTEGNAGGEIIRCRPPRLLAVTWIFDERKEGDLSEVEVRLSEDGDGTRFVLEHVATVDEERWNEFGPGAVGVGWDLTLLGLATHLRGEHFDEAALAATPEARQFMTESSQAWGAALAAAGSPGDDVERAVANTTAFYVPPPGQLG